MNKEKREIYELLDEIRELIIHSEKEGGTFKFDELRVKIALGYVKVCVEKCIDNVDIIAESETKKQIDD